MYMYSIIVNDCNILYFWYVFDYLNWWNDYILMLIWFIDFIWYVYLFIKLEMYVY